MGYYTSYNMDVNHVNSLSEHKAIVEELKDKGVMGYALHEGSWDEKTKTSCFYNYEEAKWYEHDDDMKEISKQFPDMVFKLYGTGEEADDRWYTLYKNGEYETINAEITWPDPVHINWEDS